MTKHFFLLVVLGCWASLPTGSLAASFRIGTQTLTVPDGLEIDRVTGPPLVNRPIGAAFDEQGRLYVSDSSGSNDKVDKQAQEKPHRIVRLEDRDGDGRYEHQTVFADRMMFPEGVMWLDGSVYVGAPPSIWKLTDTNADGVADQREEWHQGKTLTGCANDMHGPYLGPDGWIYWCKGAFAEQTYDLGGGKTFKSRASHIFRKRPDGSGLEVVMTGGMDNPVDVAFTPEGERFFTTTFVHQPEAGKRDGLVHAVYGGVYGKVNAATDGHKRTGELMPVMQLWGPAAPCGLATYEARALGADYQHNLFACLFNLRKVTRHELSPQGATFRCKTTDFVTSDSLDFHPTDVIEDADGSVLVIDTGGWYKLCCPTSQLAKPDVLGAIYRIRRSGALKINDPRGLKLAWKSLRPARLVELLGDERPAVRERARQALGGAGPSAVPPLARVLKQSSSSADLRRDAVWALTRVPDAEARTANRVALADSDTTVRHAAVHAAAVWRDAAAAPVLRDLLKDASPAVRRVAAEGLGRLEDTAAIPALLAAAGSAGSDRVLEHSLIYALIEIGHAGATRTGLASQAVGTRCAALIALDQMEGGGLKAAEVTPLLTSTDPALKQTAWWIVGRHGEWGDALAGFFRTRLSAPELPEPDRAELARQLGQLSRSGAIQKLLAQTAHDGSSTQARLTALRAMGQAGLKETPAVWFAELVAVLSSREAQLLPQAVSAARALPWPKGGHGELAAALQSVGRDPAVGAETRLEALAALPGGLPSVEPELFAFLQASMAPTLPANIRGPAATVLGRARLKLNQQLTLAESLRTLGPLELPRLLSAFEKADDEALGLKLVASLKESKRAGLRAELVRPLLTNFPVTVQQEGEGLLTLLNADAAAQRARLETLLTECRGGDVRRGQTVFNSPKAACATCHAIGYLGGRVGPDLTSIGQVRTERDLLEAIVFPSASFVRSYEPMIVATKAGEELSGVLRREAAEELILATGPETEVRIARADVADLRPGQVSVMPQGMDEQLTRQELADLLAFLKNTKWGAQ